MIVIPSYQRYEMKTIKLLEREGFRPNEVTIYVANQEEYDIYHSKYPYSIVIGVIGIKAQREFIQSQYPEGTILISIDDDIEDYTHYEGKNLREIFTECVDYLAKSSSGILSFNPSSNPFFSLREWKFKQGRYLACGFIYMFKVDHSIVGDIECVEDYDNSMMYLKKYGAIIRYGQACFKTKFAGNGSFQAREKYELNVDKLLGKYPDLYYNIKKSGLLKGLKNVRIRL